ncbi:hypothetical protein [uncultured Jannaschia sp.]|uniref:hypothetical protein n=1 Tax=uncultured Jannaschia sp. TaxID=293347 RepID=UPI002638B5AE|nr:hypothetical protein [uncultured Jannaschia sp.]
MRADVLLLTFLVLGGPAVAQTDAPASAIPWLSDSLRAPDAAPAEVEATPLEGTEISTSPLSGTRRDAVGLLPANATGLPRDAFAGSDPHRVAELIAELPQDALPAVQDLVLMLLLAELDPPVAATDGDTLFFARVDALLRFGALEQAQALLERAGATDSEAFRRWFDVSLLTGYDARACDAMTANPGVAPTLPARIFCLSRTGDWAAAWLSLDTGRALGAVSEEEYALLAAFLDPEGVELLPPPPAPVPMTPLAFRLLDGISEAPPTQPLPLAFAVVDLRTTTGWKAQIEAAERLVRAQALDPNRLLALYTERRPAASGSVWDRAAAVQALDRALLAQDADAVAAALPDAVERMAEAGLLVPFATLFGAQLAGLSVQGAAAEAALRVGLLSPAHAAVAASAEPVDPRDRMAVAIARGAHPGDPPEDPLARAVADGFAASAPEDLARLAGEKRLGEALLRVAKSLASGAETDPRDVARGLAFLRSVGQEDVARRIALQMLLL